MDVKITLQIKLDFQLKIVALIDSSANLNCIQEILIPIVYYEKITQRMYGANLQRLQISYKISNAYICNQNIYYKTSSLLVKKRENCVLGPKIKIWFI